MANLTYGLAKGGSKKGSGDLAKRPTKRKVQREVGRQNADGVKGKEFSSCYAKTHRRNLL